MAGRSLDGRDPRQAVSEKSTQPGNFNSIESRSSRGMQQRPIFFRITRNRTTEDLAEKFPQNLPLGIGSEKVPRFVSSGPVQPFSKRLGAPSQRVGFGFQNQTRRALAGFHPLSQDAQRPGFGGMRHASVRLHRREHSFRGRFVGGHGDYRIEHSRTNQHGRKIERLSPSGRGRIGRKIRTATAESQSHRRRRRIPPPATQGIRRGVTRRSQVVIHSTKPAERTSGHDTDSRMTDFFSLASEFVARSGKASRLPGSFDNRKCEELGSRNNPRIAGIQSCFESQLSE